MLVMPNGLCLMVRGHRKYSSSHHPWFIFHSSLATLVFGFVCWKEQPLRFFFNIWKLHKFPANEGRIIWVRSVLRLVSLVLLTSGSSKDLRSGSCSRLAYIGVDGNSHC